MWGDRYRDLPLWRFMQDPSPATLAALGLRRVDAARLRDAMVEFRRLVVAGIPQARSDLTAKVMVDLATGVTALSVNPALAVAIWQLALANASFARVLGPKSRKMSDRRKRAQEKLERYGLTGQHGLRHIPGLDGFIKGVSKKGRPR